MGLEELLSEGVISEVIARLKSGKEADVYVVRYGGNVVAAKVYKDRAQRSFKNNSAYKEGRTVRNSRSQRAINRKTTFGQAAAEDAWKSAEADALYKLHAADVRVPVPVMFLDGVLLMELVLDAEGDAAPRLIDTQLTIAEANAAYHDMLQQLVRILSCDLIHGDLSPYNVLWGAGGPTIIDFPQIISASHNSSSEAFFLRDARNILGYFASVDASLHARASDPGEIWRAYVRRELTPEFVPTVRQRPVFQPPRPRIVDPNARPHGHSQGGHSQGGHAQGGHAQGGHAQGGHAQGGGGRHPRPNPGPRGAPSSNRGNPQPQAQPEGQRSDAQHSRQQGGPRRGPQAPVVIMRRSTHPAAPPVAASTAPETDQPRSPGRRRRRRRN